jgi:hypothetical protein
MEEFHCTGSGKYVMKMQLSCVINVSDLSDETENTCVVMEIHDTMPDGDRTQ